MKFEHTSTYQASTDEVYAMLTDPAFREKVCSYVKAPDFNVEVTAGTPLVVEVTQEQPVRNVPAFATKVVGDSVVIRQVETWVNATEAELDLTIPGKPGQLQGSINLIESNGVTRYAIDGELKVRVPLIGGKLESVVEELLKAFLVAEAEVGAAWLAGDR